MTVSIHALLAECDLSQVNEEMNRGRFNPRTPCGVRPYSKVPSSSLMTFQSTHSLRSATQNRHMEYLVRFVSIHALLAECDSVFMAACYLLNSFNPRTPCGVRREPCTTSPAVQEFQSTHSLRSATAPDHIHCYSTAQTILCANLPKKAIIT